jgi:carbamoyl-phosphate synthase small subunit
LNPTLHRNAGVFDKTPKTQACGHVSVLLPGPRACAILRENETEDTLIRKAVLALADGTVCEGIGFGASAKIGGEVVFNTGIVGYPESITDPSYHGQILVQTYPLIGNYGVNPASFESDGPKISGYVLSEVCDTPSHVTSRKDLDAWLREHGIPGIAGVDTRALTKKLRIHGVMAGVLAVSEGPLGAKRIREEAMQLADPMDRDLVAEVTTPEIRIYNPRAARTVVLIDCGAKEGIVRGLVRRGVSVVRVPADTDAGRILSFSPRGAVISNGPGDPKRCAATIASVQRLMRRGLPLFGICLGNQILALAAGADTFKLKFGHRSQNQPCLEEGTRRCFITSQNHGYAVDSRTLPRGWTPWFTNANDRTNEGIRHVRRPFWSVQFHPEARPGPTDTEFLFDRFLEAVS